MAGVVDDASCDGVVVVGVVDVVSSEDGDVVVGAGSAGGVDSAGAGVEDDAGGVEDDASLGGVAEDGCSAGAGDAGGVAEAGATVADGEGDAGTVWSGRRVLS